jgi:hypothetical protein
MVVAEPWLWIQKSLGSIVALKLTIYVSLDKTLHLHKPQVLHLHMGCCEAKGITWLTGEKKITSPLPTHPSHVS